MDLDVSYFLNLEWLIAAVFTAIKGSVFRKSVFSQPERIAK